MDNIERNSDECECEGCKEVTLLRAQLNIMLEDYGKTNNIDVNNLAIAVGHSLSDILGFMFPDEQQAISAAIDKLVYDYQFAE